MGGADCGWNGNVSLRFLFLNNLFLIFSCYAQFTPNAIVDGRSRVISFALQSDNSVIATLPHFWDYSSIYYLKDNFILLIVTFSFLFLFFVALDPTFSVLLQPE